MLIVVAKDDHNVRIQPGSGLEGAMPVQGGLPIVMDGKIVGAIGVSGATGDQDSQCATAGLEALKR